MYKGDMLPVVFGQLVALSRNASALTTQSSTSVTWSTFSNVKIFGPGSDYTAPGVLYGRTEIIGDTLYATAENYSPDTPFAPIYQSTDGGQTWTHLADVKDSVNGWGITWEPHLYVLPSAVGQYPAGTMLLAADSVPKDRSAYHIDLYASTDQGSTWEFVSNVAKATGGAAIYEPFMLVYQDQLVVYFSDSRDSKYSQKLTHVTSTDLVTWETNVDDVTSPNQGDRPGMPTVASLPNGKYILTYEFGSNSDGGYHYPVYYKVADSPLDFLGSTGQELIATDGTAAGAGSPYVTWSPVGGDSGTVLVSFAGSGNLFTNKALGESGSWVQLSTNVPSAYSRSIRVLPDSTKLLIVGAGFNGNTINPEVRADVITIS
ncbi:hypothetical protein V494_08570 [Pseudogymnoascus sp. VKM F-4513 (FW-928)]|nr:hypothetical protein V494_08570 [Pseudogymnoascus sp. VKM F-4513 (FW-928)]